MEPLIAMPASFTSGETVTYTRQCSDLPLSTYGWVLYVYIAGPNELAAGPFTIDATGTCVVTLTPTQTASLAGGNYRYQETAKENVGTPPNYTGQILTWARGTLQVELNLATASSGSGQTFEETMLAALKAKVSGRLTVDQESIQIDGTAISRIPFELAERLITKYQVMVDLQQNPRAVIGSVEINFGPPALPYLPGMPLPSQLGGRP